MTVQAFWSQFLREAGLSPDTPYYSCFYFGGTEELANELLRLVLTGRKRATSSSLWAYELEGEKLPQEGDLSIVTDWAGTPRCVIRTTRITVLPFREMTFEICRREGEDENLQSWREGHIHFFTLDWEELGYAFSEDMPVVFEDFQMLYAPM